MEKLGCKTVADLLKISAEDIMKVWAPILGLYSALGIRTMPERDGIYLPFEMNTFMGALGVDAWNAWAKERTAEKFAQLTDKEKALVESYLNDIQGESYEPTVNLFSQMMFIAPQIRLSEEHTKSGGKSYTFYYRVESGICPSGDSGVHGKSIRRNLQQDHAQDVDSVCQDW